MNDPGCLEYIENYATQLRGIINHYKDHDYKQPTSIMESIRGALFLFRHLVEGTEVPLELTVLCHSTFRNDRWGAVGGG